MATGKTDSLIEKLKSYDNDAGYLIQHKEMEVLMEGTVKGLLEVGEDALDPLHDLLLYEETWSCYYSLKIIRGIGNERSIPFLIDYLMENDYTDYYEGCEEAMCALSEMGAPAVEPLLTAVKDAFGREEFYLYQLGALTKIIDDRVYGFIISTLENYIANPEKYVEWLDIVPFMFDLDKHGKKETTVPLLRAILDMDHLEEFEKVEIEDTIFVMEDPEGWKEAHHEKSERLKAILEEIDAEAAEGGPGHEPVEKVGRNQPCPCGSGKKHKHCCLKDNKTKKKAGKKHVRRRR